MRADRGIKKGLSVLLAAAFILTAPGCGGFLEGMETSASHGEAAPSASSESLSLIRWSNEDGGYYYDQLSDVQKKSYRILLKGIRDHKKAIGSLPEDQEDVFPAARAVCYDHPELLWASTGGGTFHYGVGWGSYEPVYLHAYEEGEALFVQAEAAADAFLETVPADAGDYEKVKAVFDFLVDRVDYNKDTTNCGNMYGALVEGKAKCDGYAAAAQYLLRRLDIPCTMAIGEVSGEGHGWNVVWVDGEPYHMDVTWGDPSFSNWAELPDGYRDYAYLLATTADILKTRTIDETDAAMPDCISDEDYFVREGLLLPDYPADLGELFQEAAEDHQGYLSVRFATEEGYAEALDRLFDQGEIYDFYDRAGIDLLRSTYTTSGIRNELTVFF